MNEVLEERDYTHTSSDINPDVIDATDTGEDLREEGEVPEETSVNSADTPPTPELDAGRDIRYVFKDASTGWAWLPKPAQPERSEPRITGVQLDNPTAIFFKKDLSSATFSSEGGHTLSYKAPVFEDDGTIKEEATISLDGGPERTIDWTEAASENVSFPEDSPYDPNNHLEQEYTFRLYGEGILTDANGLQLYEVDGDKFATLAGIDIGKFIDINELP